MRGLGDDAEQTTPLGEVAADQQPEAVFEFGDAHERAVIALVGVLDPPIGRLGPAARCHHARRQRADIAGHRLPRRRRHEVKIGTRPQRPILDRAHEADEAAAAVDLVDLRGLGIHRLRDFLGDEPPRIPGEIGEQRGCENREQKQVD
ncbi:hypothetical protein ACVIHC_008400 [Bradyrhizobium diazoefficiens]